MNGISKASGKDRMPDLVKAVRQLQKVREQAQALGVFTDDRELLECPTCGLMEDVTSEGLLMTCPKASADLKDCGLRFSQVDETSWECPSCGTRVTAVIS